MKTELREQVFGNMAEKTGTLWENATERASFNHCVSAYAAVVLLRCLLGVREVRNGEVILTDAYEKKHDCRAVFHFGDRTVHVCKTAGKRTVFTETAEKPLAADGE